MPGARLNTRRLTFYTKEKTYTTTTIMKLFFTVGCFFFFLLLTTANLTLRVRASAIRLLFERARATESIVTRGKTAPVLGFLPYRTV